MQRERPCVHGVGTLCPLGLDWAVTTGKSMWRWTRGGSEETEVPEGGGNGRPGLSGVTETLTGQNHFTLEPTYWTSLGSKCFSMATNESPH